MVVLSFKDRISRKIDPVSSKVRNELNEIVTLSIKVFKNFFFLNDQEWDN